MSTSDAPATNLASAPSDLVDVLAQLSFEVMGRLTKLAADADLSLTQLRLLGVLRDRRPRMAELADLLGLDRSSITGLISRAERRGLVERVVVEGDGRGVRVVLTPAGQEFTEVTAAKVAERLDDLTAPLDDAERHTLRTTIDTMLGEETGSYEGREPQPAKHLPHRV